MKQFNEVIKVEVPVQSIADKLRSMFNEDEKHADVVAETIIETTLKSRNMSYLYNSLNGFSNDINFEVGDEVNCEDTSYFTRQLGKDVQSCRQKIGKCKIVEIDIYSNSKLKVEYQKANHNGDELVKTEEWVDHTRCNKIPLQKTM